MSAKPEVALYIEPPSYHFLEDRLFELSDGRFESSFARCCAYLRDYFSTRGIPVRTADYLPDKVGSTLNLYVSTGIMSRYKQLAKRPDVIASAVFATESPIVLPSFYRELRQAQDVFRRVYTWTDSETLEPFLGGPLRCQPFHWPVAFDDVNEQLWNRTDRKSLVMINVNKLPRFQCQELYSERLRALEHFSRKQKIDLFGVGWDGPAYRVGETRIPPMLQRMQHRFLTQWQRAFPDPLLTAARSVYKGSVKSKYEVLANYTYSICFENVQINGWITEKIFDCFYTGNIPVYWGAPDVEEHIPGDCFIDMRDFTDFGELQEYLSACSSADVERYRGNAREFLRSSRFKVFTKHAFVELFKTMVEEDTGSPLETGGEVTAATDDD